jgi:serine/threonine protein kinase
VTLRCAPSCETTPLLLKNSHFKLLPECRTWRLREYAIEMYEIYLRAHSHNLLRNFSSPVETFWSTMRGLSRLAISAFLARSKGGLRQRARLNLTLDPSGTTQGVTAKNCVTNSDRLNARWMAPENFHRVYSSKSDVWFVLQGSSVLCWYSYLLFVRSYACTIYELIAGQPPHMQLDLLQCALMIRFDCLLRPAFHLAHVIPTQSETKG